MTGITFTGKALTMAHQQLLPTARPGAEPVIVLLTDGTSFDVVKGPADALKKVPRS